MAEPKTPIFWNGELVGAIASMKVDNFDVYGKWIPEDSAAAKEFLREIELQGEVVIHVGSPENRLTGTIEVPPEEEIEIKLRSNMRE